MVVRCTNRVSTVSRLVEVRRASYTARANLARKREVVFGMLRHHILPFERS